jgi:DNA-binding transcriptional regulator YdaS (Cro superfamily)
MTLKEYLKQFKVPITKFAFHCGLSVSSLTHYMNGNRKPRQGKAEAIEKESGGRVTVKELRGTDDRVRK